MATLRRRRLAALRLRRRPPIAEAIEAAAVAGIRWAAGGGGAAERARQQRRPARDLRLARCAERGAIGRFADVSGVFSTADGEPSKRSGQGGRPRRRQDWLGREQARLRRGLGPAQGARASPWTPSTRSTSPWPTSSSTRAPRPTRGALDFADLIERTQELLTERADAAWVLYKLDGGIDHVLLDEAQDTAPEQWDDPARADRRVLRRRGRARRATAAPCSWSATRSSRSTPSRAPRPSGWRSRRRRCGARPGRRAPVRAVQLLESWRSTPEVLRFVDAVFADPEAPRALTAGRDRTLSASATCAAAEPRLRRPLAARGESDRARPIAWAPVDAEPPRAPTSGWPRRIAARSARWSTRGEAVIDKDAGPSAPRHALRRRADPGAPARRPVRGDHPRAEARRRAGGRAPTG